MHGLHLVLVWQDKLVKWLRQAARERKLKRKGGKQGFGEVGTGNQVRMLWCNMMQKRGWWACKRRVCGTYSAMGILSSQKWFVFVTEAVLFFCFLMLGTSLEGSMNFDAAEVIAVVAVLVFAVKRKETKRIGGTWFWSGLAWACQSFNVFQSIRFLLRVLGNFAHSFMLILGNLTSCHFFWCISNLSIASILSLFHPFHPFLCGI